jgi:endonuclease YncB( thermonuclease family)
MAVTVTYADRDRYDRVVGTVFKPDCANVNLQQVA